MSQSDNSVNIWWNLPISNHKPDLHNINAHTKFGENPLMFTGYHPKKKNRQTDVQLMDRRADKQTDTYVQHETITPHHYFVAGYNQ